MTSPVWQEIMMALATINAKPRDELVDGFLLLTPEQHDALVKYDVDQWISQGRPNRSAPNPMFTIPTLTIEPDQPIRLPSRRVAVNDNGTIYVVLDLPAAPPKPKWYPTYTPGFRTGQDDD